MTAAALSGLPAAGRWADAVVRAEPGGTADVTCVQLRGDGAVDGGGSVEELPAAERRADAEVRVEPGEMGNAARVKL